MSDQRSTEAQNYHRWYKLAVWQARRTWQLAHKPLCEMCAERGLTVPANTVDHVEPHKGDWIIFIQGKLSSLCAPCHSSVKQSQERTGYTKGVDVNGQPTDPGHPWNVTA